MKVKINKRNEIAEGTLEVELGIVNGTIDFKAGQFFSLRFPQLIANDKRGNSRFLGFVNPPSQNNKIITIIRKGTSDFKKYLQEADLETEAEVENIRGEMTIGDKPTVVIAGGIGIVPYLSILSEIYEKKLGCDLTLIYSNTNKLRAIYLDKLQEWITRIPGFRLVTTMTDTESRINEQMIRNNIGEIDDKYFMVSGTPRFVPDMIKLLNGMWVKPENRKFEIFTGY